MITRNICFLACSELTSLRSPYFPFIKTRFMAHHIQPTRMRTTEGAALVEHLEPVDEEKSSKHFHRLEQDVHIAPRNQSYSCESFRRFFSGSDICSALIKCVQSHMIQVFSFFLFFGIFMQIKDLICKCLMRALIQIALEIHRQTSDRDLEHNLFGRINWRLLEIRISNN